MTNTNINNNQNTVKKFPTAKEATAMTMSVIEQRREEARNLAQKFLMSDVLDSITAATKMERYSTVVPITVDLIGDSFTVFCEHISAQLVEYGYPKDHFEIKVHNGSKDKRELIIRWPNRVTA